MSWHERVDDERLWLALRLVTGGFLMPHGLQKLFNILGSPGRAALAAMFEQKAGLVPGAPFVMATGAIELLAGAALALGLFVRVSALGGLAVLVAAMVLVNGASGFFWTKGGIEYPAMWALLCLCFMTRGSGPYSLDAYLPKIRHRAT